METGHATAKAVRLADTSKPPTRSEAPRDPTQDPTRCAHLPTASQGVWSIWLSARNAQNSMSARQRMPCTSASMATDMTSEKRRCRNQWLSTSVDMDTPWMTLPSWSLRRFQRVMFRLEEDVKNMNGNGLAHSVLWILMEWIVSMKNMKGTELAHSVFWSNEPLANSYCCITSLPACFNHSCTYEDPVGFELLYMKWWILNIKFFFCIYKTQTWVCHS